MPNDSTVFVVDDDPDIRASLKHLLDALGKAVAVFESAEAFLQAGCATAPGCVLLDVRMPGMSGLQLLDHLNSYTVHPPVVLLSAHGDIPMVLRALKAGALDFIEKPANPQALIDAVLHACAIDRETRAKESAKAKFNTALESLTKREREVVEQMVAGVANKVIAINLDVSERTLEKHRKHIMEKMGAKSLAELTRMMTLREKQ